MSQTPVARTSALRTLPLASILWMVSPMAQGQPTEGPATTATRPFTLGVSQAFTHDTNLFRSPSGTPSESDLRSVTGLAAGLNQPMGRQRLHASAAVAAHRFRDFDSLDHVASSAHAGIDWSTVERLSGTLRYAYNRSLADYGTAGAPRITTRNLESAQLAEFTARYGITARTALRAGLEHRRVDYSAQAFRDREYRQDVVALGIEHGVERALRLGVGVRHTDGRRPRFTEVSPGVFRADDSTRRDVDLTAEWTPTGRSTLNGRISHSQEDHSAPELADFSGITGSLGWDYALTGKIRMRAQFDRDTGAETRFADFTGEAPDYTLDSSRVTNTAQLGLRYAPTAKIEVQTGYRHSTGKLSSTSGESGRDTTRAVNLGIHYAISRSFDIGCQWQHERRTSHTSLSSPYRATVTTCLARLALR